jgi:N-acetylmuramoyl-L-alanine amidase
MGVYGKGGGFWARRLSPSVLGALLCLSLASPSHAGDGGDLLQVRFGGDRDSTRVVVELDAPTKGQVIADGASDGVLVMGLAKVSAGAEPQGRGVGLVGAWTTRTAAGGAQLRLQLSRRASIVRRFLLPPTDGVSVYRYVIDLAATDQPAGPQPAPAPGVALQPEPAVWRTTAPPAPAAVAIKPLRLKKVIVIDAGHGGKDPGAQGTYGREKDINLAAARALKARLERGGHYRVVMTRDTDTFVPLETRVQIARAADADLFISLHSDSGSSADMRGATVYTLSDKGSDRVVRNVMSANDWFINVNLPGRDRAVNQILLDLTQRATRNRSAAFAETLLDHIGPDTPLQEHSHRDAGFMVLLAPDVPAVLLEMGFITNRDDEARLSDPVDRHRLMNAVGDSIDDYFARQTQVAEQ